jgi:hypothetical protein
VRCRNSELRITASVIRVDSAMSAFWPSSDGSPISGDCRFEIIHASDVLDDIVTGTIPNIHAEREVGLCLHGAAPGEKQGFVDGGCYHHAIGVRTE